MTQTTPLHLCEIPVAVFASFILFLDLKSIDHPSPHHQTAVDMGRRKITIEKIANPRTRAVTFSKRRIGLEKKAVELSVLCGCKLALIIVNGDKVFEFCSEDLQSILQARNNASDIESITADDLDALQPGRTSLANPSTAVRGARRKRKSSDDEEETDVDASSSVESEPDDRHRTKRSRPDQATSEPEQSPPSEASHVPASFASTRAQVPMLVQSRLSTASAQNPSTAPMTSLAPALVSAIHSPTGLLMSRTSDTSPSSLATPYSSLFTPNTSTALIWPGSARKSPNSTHSGPYSTSFNTLTASSLTTHPQQNAVHTPTGTGPSNVAYNNRFPGLSVVPPTEQVEAPRSAPLLGSQSSMPDAGLLERRLCCFPFIWTTSLFLDPGGFATPLSLQIITNPFA